MSKVHLYDDLAAKGHGNLTLWIIAFSFLKTCACTVEVVVQLCIDELITN